MRAAVVERYGPPDVVRVAEVAAPSPRADEVLVQVEAAAVTSADARIRAARFPRGFALPARLAFGLRRPRRPVLGSSFSGVVVATGAKVEGVGSGDRVSGMTGSRLGAHAQYVVVPERSLVALPPGVSHDDAAGVSFGGTTALHFLRDRATVASGSSVLVNGASGAVGTNAVQLARHFGATVTAVTSGANAALVTELGADRVVDHTRVDIEELGERFDVVFDTVGNISMTAGRRLLTDRGILLLGVADLLDTVRSRGNVAAGPAPERPADIDLLVGLVAEGALRVVVDGVLGLDDVVEAHRRVDTGHKVGNVILHP